MEELMEDEIFKNIQKHGQEFYTKDLTQNNYSEDDEPENLMFDKAQIKENLKAHLKEENLYDPLLDSKEEEWTKTNLSNILLLYYYIQ